MVGIGIVGVGFMGMIHYLATGRVPGARVAAICSRDPRKRAGDWTGIQGNFGPRGEHVDLAGVARHEHFADLLADSSVDLVDLCVPNDGHAPMAIQALEAGKHVLVEKPIALTLDDADAMLAAARSSGRMLMVAHVLPFFHEFQYAQRMVRSGQLGPPRTAHLSRVIARPSWSAEIGDSRRSGGPAIDLHIHDTHFVGLLFGVPRAVSSRGVIEGGAVTYLSTQYLFEDPNFVVSAVSGATSQPGRPFTHGYELAFERGLLWYGSANVAGRSEVHPLRVFHADGGIEQPDVGTGDPIDSFTREIAAAVASLTTGEESPILSARLARQALGVCLAEVESARRGQPILLS